MSRTMIGHLRKKIGQEVEICGWVHVLRNQGGIQFLIIRDITGRIQIVVSRDNLDAFNIVEILSLESVVKVTGTLKSEKQAP